MFDFLSMQIVQTANYLSRVNPNIGFVEVSVFWKDIRQTWLTLFQIDTEELIK